MSLNIRHKNKASRGARLRIRLFTAMAIMLLMGTSLGGVLAVLKPSTAFADGPQFTLYFNNDARTIGALVAAAKDGGIGSDDTGGALRQTHVITRGSKLGTAVLNLNSSESDKQDIPIYSVDYYCSPTEGYKYTLSKPDDSKPYVRYTFGVGLNDWRANFPHDQRYDTYTGMVGNKYIGTAHYPEVVNARTGNKAAADFSIPGAGGDRDLRTGVDSGFTTPNNDFKDSSKSLPDDSTVFKKCMISPLGHNAGNQVTNYNKLSKSQQQSWDKAVKDGGLGGSVSGASNPGGGGSGGSADDISLGCEGSANPLSWIICPVINDLLVPAIAWTDNLITDQMVIPADQIFCSSSKTCDAYYKAWSSFRNIALGLLVVAGLIVIIGQAIGMEILDAYTIRKVLPRIVIVAIAITLSWTLMNFAVTLSNNLGFGIRDIIVAPFHDLNSSISLDFGSGVGNNFITNIFFGGAALAAGVPIWIALGGLGVLLSYIATAGLAVLVAVLVLILREIAIIMLILLSPIALLTYVLPNTQRVFRLWWESFSKALLMFPLIAGFIAAGRVFAAISLSDTSGGGIGPVLHGVIAFVAYFGPYFAIPLTFSMSGAMMSGMGNMINQRAQGLQGLLGNYRRGQMQSRIARARAKGLYREGFGRLGTWRGKERSVGKALNTLGFWGLNADEMVPMKLGTTDMMGLKPGKRGIPGFRRGGQALEAQIKRANRDQTVKAAQDLDIGYKSGRLMGGEYQYYEGGLTSEGQKKLYENFAEVDKEGNFQGFRAPQNWGERQRLADIFTNDAIAEGGINPVTGKEYTAADVQKGNEAREAGGELRGVASEFEKYTTDAETNRTDGRLLGLLSAAKAGRLEMSDVANNYNRHLDAGDQESAIRETTLLQDALTPKRVSAARGHSLWWDEQGRAHSAYEDPTSLKAQTSLARINTQEIAGSKSEDIDALEETLVAGASGYQMQYDKKRKKVVPKIEQDRSKPGYGRPVAKDKDSTEGKRVKEVRGRIKQLALYNYGDTDVGRKIRNIWVDRLGLDESELEWGGGRKGTAEDAEIARHAGGADKPPEEPQPQA